MKDLNCWTDALTSFVTTKKKCGYSNGQQQVTVTSFKLPPRLEMTVKFNNHLQCQECVTGCQQKNIVTLFFFVNIEWIPKGWCIELACFLLYLKD